jgi:hypothetical protein
MKAGVSVLGAYILKVVIGCPYSDPVIIGNLPSESDVFLSIMNGTCLWINMAVPLLLDLKDNETHLSHLSSAQFSVFANLASQRSLVEAQYLAYGSSMSVD